MTRNKPAAQTGFACTEWLGIMATTQETKGKNRVIEVTMKFYKVFHVEVPEGVTESDVLESELVEDEMSSSFGSVSMEHDETRTCDNGFKSPEEIERLKRHEKVFKWENVSNA